MRRMTSYAAAPVAAEFAVGLATGYRPLTGVVWCAMRQPFVAECLAELRAGIIERVGVTDRHTHVQTCQTYT